MHAPHQSIAELHPAPGFWLAPSLLALCFHSRPAFVDGLPMWTTAESEPADKAVDEKDKKKKSKKEGKKKDKDKDKGKDKDKDSKKKSSKSSKKSSKESSTAGGGMGDLLDFDLLGSASASQVSAPSAPAPTLASSSSAGDMFDLLQVIVGDEERRRGGEPTCFSTVA